MQDVNDFPEDTKKNTEVLPFPKNSKKKCIYIMKCNIYDKFFFFLHYNDRLFILMKFR